MMAETIGVSCEMIIQKDGKVLMGKRGKTFGEGSWAFPGGHLEVGETTENCVTRELGEEIGIKPTKMSLVGVVNDLPNIQGQARHYVRFVYLIEEFVGDIENKEPLLCDGWEWFDISNLPQPVFVGHVKPLEMLLSDRKTLLIEK